MVRKLALLAWLALSQGACGGDDELLFPPAGPADVRFPASFLWGSATAAFPVEKGLSHTDWGIWAGLPGKVAGGDEPDAGPDALAHIVRDVGLMREAGLGSYRFGLEFARVYPTREAFEQNQPDAAALATYGELVDRLRAAGIEPMVTLHAFTWPDYLSDPRDAEQENAWERPETVTAFEAWCHHMAAYFGDRVDLWITIQEPNVEAALGYLHGVFPPGVRDIGRMVDVLGRQLDGHARCYDAIHRADEDDADGDGAAALASIASHSRVYEPADPADPADRAAAEHSRRFWNGWFLDAIVRGDLDEDFDDAVDVEDDARFAGRADFIALDYHGVARIDASGPDEPYLGELPEVLDLPGDRPKTDLGWDIHPAGLGAVLDQASLYGLPIFVTENGIADAADENRSRFLAEHLFELGLALGRGLDVRGYYHWSLIDHFAWRAGFCPRFGLFAVDYDSPSRERSETAAVPLLREVAASGRLAQTTLDALPPYAPPAASCR